jgi:hypothetical protein
MYIYIYICVCVCVCVCVCSKGVKDKNVNSKCTHRQMTRLWLTKERPGLSSERAPDRDKTTNSRPNHLKRKQYLVKRPQSGLEAKTHWLTVSRKVTLTLALTLTLAWVVQWLRLALSKGPNRVGVSPPPSEDGNKSSFRNIVFSSYLEFRAMNKSRKPVIMKVNIC